ncbi:di-trans,poly-cis-decaprenylcistransferase [candidate division WWE3 bacterium]|nr:di-trans,poly-cis-decaprenylcistransferase [candidate division WWE3 bacterium]
MFDSTHISLPTHIGIIMDGNRRWAHSRSLSHVEGHREARQRISEIIEELIRLKIPYVTLWAWSTKNWKRNQLFIQDMFGLARESLSMGGWFQDMVDIGVKFSQVGVLNGFPDDIRNKVESLLSVNPTEQKIQVNLAIGYEGRDEIIRAVRALVADGVKPEEVTFDAISQKLDTRGIPDVDLLIRTGGEVRTSGFMIWQCADAELCFTKCLMPDFTVDELHNALAEYGSRERRLGGDSKKY